MNKKIKSSKGFTIIELIVVMAIFLLVIGAAIGIFLSIVKNQKKVLAEQQLLNQISYAEEHMSKALRMAKTEGTTENCLVDPFSADHSDHPGYIYLLTRYDNGIFRGVKFINQSDNDACTEFFWDSATNQLKELKDSTNDSNATALTSANLQINSVKFSVNGSDGSAYSNICHGNPSQDCGASKDDSVQPRVTITLNVKVPNDSQEPNRIIQTTVSQRNLTSK